MELLDIARQLLTTRGRMLDRWIRYLAAYKVVEGNLSLFDKLARCRDLREFQDALYEAARVKDRVMDKLKKGLARGEFQLSRQPEDFEVDDKDLKELVELATANERAPRVVGSLVASFALLHPEPRRVSRP
mgnify:CR=1 FL=1